MRKENKEESEGKRLAEAVFLFNEYLTHIQNQTEELGKECASKTRD